jgi:hypothetical protein
MRTITSPILDVLAYFVGKSFPLQSLKSDSMTRETLTSGKAQSPVPNASQNSTMAEGRDSGREVEW